MDHRKRAEKIYNETRPDPRYVKMMGEASLTPVQRASLEEIENHLVLVAEVAAEYSVNLDASKIEFGASRDAVVEIAEARVRRNRRSAGARALSRKYGKDAAERIIQRKTGRSVRLQS